MIAGTLLSAFVREFQWGWEKAWSGCEEFGRWMVCRIYPGMQCRFALAITSWEKQLFCPQKTDYRPISGGHSETIPIDIIYLSWHDPTTTLKNPRFPGSFGQGQSLCERLSSRFQPVGTSLLPFPIFLHERGVVVKYPPDRSEEVAT